MKGPRRSPSRAVSLPKGKHETALVLDLFDRFHPGESWTVWRAGLSAIFGLPMSEAEADLVRRCTGRQTVPTTPAREAWLVVGRRGGKSRVAALIAVYLACFRDYSSVLAPGETGTLMLIAADRRQARTLKRYISGLLRAAPALERLIVNETKEGIELSNRITIEIHTASFRTTRGYTIVGVVADEIAFWSDESSSEPDSEIINALRPGMATVGGALLLAISSPYARRGELFRAYSEHFGKDDDPILVWQAPTLTMNCTVPRATVDHAYAADEAAASAEYGAQFRRDIESLLTREALAAVVVTGRRELPPMPGIQYAAFVDPSGGSSDSMTLAIGHRELDRVVLDFIIERRPPFSPEAVVTEFADVLQRYGVSTVVGDHYAGEWPRERFKVHGVTYEVAEQSASELYLAFLPHVNSTEIQLLDHPRLLGQLAGLERRTGRTGRDTVSHGPGGHDDLANAAAGAIVTAFRGPRSSELPDFTCWKERQQPGFSMLACFLSGEGMYLPSANDPSCHECEGLKIVQAARRMHVERSGQQTDIRTFFREFMEPPRSVQMAALRRFAKMNPYL